jgi:alkanesulfonate monooxygenase SsuD/methylene tetrahydromethanopterin reductase-like flavin-dependent oxidoreductase (luciferase family)
VGLGSDRFGREYSAFGQPADDLTHADMLDEGLEVLTGLWSGESFSHSGQHYYVDRATFLPKPLQQPRIPIWVAATWPNKRPLRRAARFDGVIPASKGGGLSPSDYVQIAAYIKQYRDAERPFDMVRPANLPRGAGREVTEQLAEYEAAGVTWWLVPVEDDMGTPEQIEAVIRQGPPSVRAD